MNFIPRIGIYEKSTDKEPIQRNFCDMTKDSDWSEIKTSLIINELYNDSHNNKILIQEQLTICQNYCLCFGFDFLKEKEHFKKNLKDNWKKNNWNYPVGQLQVWIDNNTEDMWSDIFFICNFEKYLFVKQRNKNDRNNLINILNENAFIMGSIFRCNERFLPLKNDVQITSDILGITNRRHLPMLKIKIPKVDNDKIMPWIHTGYNDCIPLYWGKYGEHLKNYKNSKNDDTYYSSILCGISMSTNISYWMYIAALTNKISDNLDCLKRSVYLLIIKTIMLLAGDGGHNIREIIVGLTIVNMYLKMFIEDINEEFNNFIKDERKYNITTIPELLDELINGKLDLNKLLYNHKYKLINIYLFKSTEKHYKDFFYVLKKLFPVKKFVDVFWECTKELNLSGVTEKDLSKNNDFHGLRANTNENTLKNLRYFIYEKMHFNLQNDESMNDIIQLYISLENNRHKQDVDEFFKKGPNNLFKMIVNEYNPAIIPKVDKKLDEYINTYNCELPKKIQNSNEIPFAFKNKGYRKSARKSRRKSPVNKGKK